MAVVLLVGIHGESTGAHRTLQANSVKTRRVLSLFTVGLELITNGPVAASFLTNLRRFAALLSEGNDYLALNFRGDP